MQDVQKQNIVIPDEIRVYLEDLLSQAGIIDIDSVVKEAMLQELFVRLDQFLATKVIDYLPVDKLDEFTQFTQSKPSQEKMQQYLQSHLPNAQDVFIVAFGEFRDMYLKNIKNAKQVQANS